MTTIEGELFPASLIHTGDTYLDLTENRTFTALDVRHTPGAWFVFVTRDDGTEQRYFINEPVRIVM